MPAEERREAILTAARPLLLQHGDDLSTRQIAAAAGVAEGTLFRVFENKDAIVDALLTRALDPGPTCRRLAALDPGAPLDERVGRAVGILTEQIHQVSSLVSATVRRGLRPDDADWQRAARRRHHHGQHLQQLTEALVEVLRPDADRLAVPLPLAAGYIRSAVFATTHPYFTDGTFTGPQQLTAVLLHGLCPDPAAPATPATCPGRNPAC